MTEAWPLAWPAGWKRTKHPKQSRFDVSFTEALDGLLNEVRLLGGTLPVLSSNLELRKDGLPYANQRRPDDAGVAIYFTYKGEQRVLACDRWRDVKDNMRAIQKTIDALRGMERWGASEMMERAFSGFQALPAPGETAAPTWRQVMNFTPSEPLTAAAIHARYRELVKTAHPDSLEGSHQKMMILIEARDQGLRAIGA